jgi:F420-dependent oxidoreductase-like protein
VSEIRVPSPALVVLVGASGSGKSTWAAANSRPGEVVSSDDIRQQVGESTHDQRANKDVFELVDEIVRRRLARKLFTIVDATSLDDDGRAKYRQLAADAGVPCIAIAFPTDAATCRKRNNARAMPVPGHVLKRQLAEFDRVAPLLSEEGFHAAYAAPLPLRRQPSTTGLRFGLQLPRHGWDGDRSAALRDVAQAAEAVGFTSLWVMDHFIQIPQAGREWDDLFEAYTTLGFLAGVTAKATLGTLVTGVTYRNVALLGKMIATLDVLSNGRAVAGLGAAWYEREHVAYGFEFPPLKQRYALLEDALELLPLMWGKGAPSFEGRVVTVPEAMAYPRPVQEHIPILVGGSGEKKTLRLVARYADACNLFGDPAMIRRKLEVLARHCDDVGRDPADIEVTQLGTAAPSGDPVPHFAALHDAGDHTAIVNFPGEPTAETIAGFGTVVNAFAN